MDSTLNIELLGYIDDSIRVGNNEDIEQFLNLVEFKDLDYTDSIKFIIQLLKMCLKYDNSEAGLIVYNKNQDFYDLDSDIQFHTVLFLNRAADVNLMKFIIYRVIPGTTFMNTTRELIQILADYNDSELKEAFSKVLKVYPKTSLSALKDLYEYAKSVNQSITEELLRLIRQMNNYADIPKWMINKGILPKESLVKSPIEDSDPNVDTISLGLPESEQLIKRMMELIEEELIDRVECDNLDLVREILLSQYRALSLPQKYEFAKQFVAEKNLEAMGKDVTLFITLGPSAPFRGSSIENLGDLVRMFTFTQLEYDEDQDSFELDENLRPPFKDWFVGYCQQCDLRIRRRWHAVRVPMRYGGWQGCMCSWKCAKDSIVSFDKSDPVMLTLCDIYEQEMINYGIIDRIPDEEYDEYLSAIANTITEGTKEPRLEGSIDLKADLSEGIPIGTTIEDISQVINPANVTVEESSPILLLYFYADDCDICIKFTPQLEQLVEYTTYQRGIKKLVNLRKINTNEQDVQEYQVTSIPTVIFYHKEIPVQIFSGNQIRPILNLILSYGYQ